MLTQRYRRTDNLRWKYSYSSQVVSFAHLVYRSYPPKNSYTKRKKNNPSFCSTAFTPGLFVGVALSLVGMMYVFFHTPS